MGGLGVKGRDARAGGGSTAGSTQFALLHATLFLGCVSSLRVGEVTTRALGSMALPPMWEARSFGMLFIGSSVGGCVGSIAGTRLYELNGGEFWPFALAVAFLLVTGGVLAVMGRRKGAAGESTAAPGRQLGARQYREDL